VRPEIVRGVGYDPSVRNTRSILSSKTESKTDRSLIMLICFAAIGAAMILLAYITTFFYDIGGTDDAGAGTIGDLIPGYEQLTDNFIQLGEFGISILFIIQTIIGIAILAYTLHLYKRKKQHELDAPP